MSVRLVWFRSDLRLDDQPALAAALAAGGAVVPVYVLDETRSVLTPGAASRWWLHGSLAALDTDLRARGARLVLRRGDPATQIERLIAETGATAIHWTRRYAKAHRDADAALKTRLRESGVEAHSHNGALLHEPWEVTTGAGGWFKVFTPFWKACLARPAPAAPVPAPAHITGPATWPASDALAYWRLRPTAPDWAIGLAAEWTPGEAGAQARLASFLDHALDGYRGGRDLPGRESTSRLSPHLAFGELSPRRVLQAVRARPPSADADKFLAELGWREFSHNLLFHHDDLATRSFRPEFDAFPWATDARALTAWRRGRTGYPLVDAGMRELWTTGWMHNRVRMVVASFLVKHLLIDWREGERWFWDTLVDADPANNAASWQWVAGCGADAAPYFRVFNPVLQGAKFDADGAYVRRWVPELAALPHAHLHQPWAAPSAILAAAGITLGKDYPRPIVEHNAARTRALAAFATLRNAA
ncbi:MAG: deoxyribodipyrimidine photo-lyase [Alphaproteobacteria bacterium]|nr:deoxyribodipyrimidine photo-lyase [Alphaproteobacteria bacterium]